MLAIETSRFGSVGISDDDIIQFNEGILGFPDLRRFVLLDDPNEEIFAWLQSADTEEIAFPVLEPELFYPEFNVQLTKKDLESLDAGDGKGLRYFMIITIPDDPTQMTANLKAPIVVNVNNRMARQCVLQDHTLNIREPIFSRLQQRVVSNPSATIRSQASDWGVAVKLGETAPKREPEATP